MIPRILAVLVGVLSFLPRAAVAQNAAERLFYYVDREDSYNSLVKHVDQITVLGPQVYVIDSLGIMWGSLDRRVDALARKHGVKIMPLFTNEGFQQPGLRRLLPDTVARNRASRRRCDSTGRSLHR